MKIIWTSIAKEKLKRIFRYYKKKASVKVANNIRKEIQSTLKNLNEFSEIG